MHRANSRTKTTWYKQVRKDIQTFKIPESDEVAFRKMIQEVPLREFQKAIRQERKTEIAH